MVVYWVSFQGQLVRWGFRVVCSMLNSRYRGCGFKPHICQFLYVIFDWLNDFNTFISNYVTDIIDAIRGLKNGKSAGLDKIYSEHFKFAHDNIAVLLAICFNAMLSISSIST